MSSVDDLMDLVHTQCAANHLAGREGLPFERVGMHAIRHAAESLASSMAQWQDIATAPKDGTLIDLAVVNVTSAKWNEMFEREPVDVSQYERIADAYWKDDNWCVRRTGGDGEDYDSEIADIGWWGSTTPTHWQPLPHLPLSASPEDKPK